VADSISERSSWENPPAARCDPDSGNMDYIRGRGVGLGGPCRLHTEEHGYVTLTGITTGSRRHKRGRTTPSSAAFDLRPLVMVSSSADDLAPGRLP